MKTKHILIGFGAVVLLLVLLIGIMDSGWVIVPEWYAKTTRYQSRALKSTLHGMAISFQQMNVLPPDNSSEIYEEEPERWGAPIQYSYEKGVPTLRAAGKDGLLNTEDDIIQKVAFTSSTTR